MQTQMLYLMIVTTFTIIHSTKNFTVSALERQMLCDY